MAISFNNTRQFNSNVGNATQSSHFYYVLNSSSTFTSRSQSGATDLFTDTAVVGDYLLFKCSHGPAKFQGLIFDVSTAIVAAAHTIVWEYRKADSSWAALAGVTDNTVGFTVVGSNSVTWTMPTDWGTNATAINTITGAMWIRARLSVATTLTEGGRTTAALQMYDYSIKVESNHEYDSGTATSGTTSTITNTGKAYTTDILRNRIVYIHTGTNAGQFRVILSNTATTITILDLYNSAIDTSSQYVILANFEDLYQASVSGGWGVVSRAGLHSYAFSCWVNFEACAFGDVNANVEFTNDFYFYCTVASTNRYPLCFGWRLPSFYGLDKGIMGNNISSNRTTPMDNRAIGFTVATDYAFSSGNVYILRFDSVMVSSTGFLRCWFNNYHRYSINDYFEGWRSVTFGKTTSPRTEVRNLNVSYGYSGIEQPFADFDGVKSIYSASLGVYFTTSNTITAPSFEVTPSNFISGTRFSSPIQYFACNGTQYVIDYKGNRVRPMIDTYGSTPNNFVTFIQNTIRALITDENNNLLSNAKVQISDSLAQNRDSFLVFDGSNDVVTAANTANNQFSGSTSYSVEAWVRQNGVGGSSYGRILDKINGTTGFMLSSLSNSYRFVVYTNNTAYTSNTVASVTRSWAHVVGVWNGSNVKLYVNNTTGTATNTTGSPGDDTGRDLHIGNRAAADSGWDGHIARVRIFRNKELSSGEVNTLWNNGDRVPNQSCPVSGCTAEYNFTEGTGTTLADTINGNTANLGASTAAPTWIDSNTGATSNAITAYTGTASSFHAGFVSTHGGSFSLTNQPTSPTRLRFVVTNYYDTQSNAGSNGNLVISGTDLNDNAISDVVFVESIGNGVYYTKKEFKTVNTSGIYTLGFSATVTVDNLGILAPQTVNVERWQSFNDSYLLTTIYTPIVVKVTRPGYEPVIIKKEINEPQNWHIAMKRSVIDIS